MFVIQDQWTLLHTAAKHGHNSTVERLITYGADVNAAEVVSWLCARYLILFCVCYSGSVDSITYCFTIWS